jgi:hypothetical protein
VTIAGGAPDPQFHKGPLILGVVGREYPGNRKGTEALAEIRRLPGVEVRFTGGRLPFARLPEFYKSIDYLLVLSRNEGGPLPVLEALAMGKPVIAPDVGWCWEHPVIRYHTIDELKGILTKLVIPRDLCEKQSAMLMGVFERLIAARRDARGYSSDAACTVNMDSGPASTVSA